MTGSVLGRTVVTTTRRSPLAYRINGRALRFHDSLVDGQFVRYNFRSSGRIAADEVLLRSHIEDIKLFASHSRLSYVGGFFAK
jgi:hypothetical protein